MKRWLRVLRWLGLGGAVLALGLGAAVLALPGYLQGQLQQRGSELLGRTVRVGDVSVQPMSLAVTVRKLSLASGNPAVKDPQATIDRLRVDLKWQSLLRWAPVVESLEVDAPKARLARVADGRYDIDDLIQRLRPDPQQPSAMPRFALYNLKVRGGEFRFDDQPVGRQQRVSKLNLTLPFLSNLPADVEVEVEPRLSFLLNGTAFDTGASATPFAQARHADLTLRFAGYQLEPLQAYLPADLHIRPRRGKLDGSLALRFTQDDDGSRVTLRGEVAARDVTLLDSASRPVAAWQALRVTLNDVQPLARRVALGPVRVEGLVADIARDANGRLNLLPPAAAASGAAAAASAPTAADQGPLADWQLQLEQLELVGAQLQWRDDTVQPPVQWRARGVDLSLGAIAWPLAGPVNLKLAGDLVQGEKSQPAGRVVAEGTLGSAESRLALELKDVALDPANPYLSPWLAARLEAKLSAVGQLHWAQGDTPRSLLKLSQLKLADVKLQEAGEGRPAGAAWRSLDFSDTDIDLLARTVTVAKLGLSQPQLTLLRDADGRWNAEHWLRPGTTRPGAKAADRPGDKPVARKPAASATGAAASAAAAASAPAEWSLDLRDTRVDGGRVRLLDGLHGDPPIAMELDGLKLSAQGLRWPGDAKTAPAALQASARLVVPSAGGADPAPQAGQLDWRGKLQWQPLRAEGRLQAERLPLHMLDPYLNPGSRLDLLRGEAGFTGDLQLRHDSPGLFVSAQGDGQLADLSLAARRGGELLSWRTLALQGLKLQLQPGARPQLDLNEVTLSDFFARLVVTEQGRLNLQDVAAPAAAAVAASGASAAAAPPSAAAPVAAPASAADAAGDLPLALTVARTRLVNGKVDFADRFIRPNYSAALTELNGSLGAVSNTRRDGAALELRGRVAGSAVLDVAGQLNPLARPLALELRAKASDLDLVPLSPYAAKYAGHGIERGRLTMEADYKVLPDGKLEARNRLVLNQLTFGDKVDSPDATKLPVTLAVALLKDRQGVIDVNLPISGSLNDPQFSMGAVVGKALLNLVAKAVTAPFALLGGGGGGDDLGAADFEAGSARLSDKGRRTLDRLAQALADRPALRLGITGTADPVAEQAALQAQRGDASAEAARDLAQQRGQAVRDALLAKGLPAERLLLAAPRLRGAGEDDATWSPRALLSLSAP